MFRSGTSATATPRARLHFTRSPGWRRGPMRRTCLPCETVIVLDVDRVCWEDRLAPEVADGRADVAEPDEDAHPAPTVANPATATATSVNRSTMTHSIPPKRHTDKRRSGGSE